MSNKQPFEREFESFLNDEDSRLAALYRKLPRPEPDAKLDAAVLAMARRAQAGASRPRARTSRWIPALSAAAIVTLAAGVAFRIGPTVWQEHDGRELQKTASENVAVPTTPEPQAAAKAQPQDSDAFKDKAASKPALAPAPAGPSESAPAAPAATNASPVRQESRAPFRKLAPAAGRIDGPAVQAFPTQVSPEQEKKTEANHANAVDATAAQTGDAADAQMLDSKRDERAAQPEGVLKMREEPAPPSSPAPPPPAMEAPAPLQAESSPVSAAEVSTGNGAPAASLAAPAPQAKPARMAPLRSKDPNARLYPEHWLQNIRTMLHENKRDAALRSLMEFHKMYPDYRLPDDLRDLK